MLGLSRTSLYAMAAQGDAQFVCLSGRTLVRRGRALAEVEEALQHTSAICGYQTWLSVLQALHEEFEADGLTLAEEWSATAPHRYQEGVVEQKFASLSKRGGVTISTVFELARKAGADLGQLRHKHFDVAEFFQPESPAIFEDSTATPGESSMKRRGLPLMSFAEAAAAASAAGADPLIEGLLDVGAAFVVFGPSNVGKTFVVLDMAHAVATGRAWAGRITTRAGVLYLALEGGGGIRKRFAALQKDQAGAVPANFIPSCAPIDLCNSSDSTQDIIETAANITARKRTKNARSWEQNEPRTLQAGRNLL